MRRVILETPFRADTPEEMNRNIVYARVCAHYILTVMGDAPIISHLLYTQPGILRDEIPEERHLGIEAGLLWGTRAEVTVVGTDLGITDGMREGVDRARAEGRPVEKITLGEKWNKIDPLKNPDPHRIVSFPEL